MFLFSTFTYLAVCACTVHSGQRTIYRSQFPPSTHGLQESNPSLLASAFTPEWSCWPHTFVLYG